MNSTNAAYEWDDDDDQDETQSGDSSDEDTDTDDDQSDDSDTDDSSSDDDDSDSNDDRDGGDDISTNAQSDEEDNGDGEQALNDAAPHEVDAHRNLIGDALEHLSDRGIDVEELAEKAGVESTDVDELTHGDLAGITQYIAQHHPEALQAVESRYPAAQGILGALTGGNGGGGLLGRLFGR